MSDQSKKIVLLTGFLFLLAMEFLVPTGLVGQDFQPGMMSILPPVIAIAMALITREIILSIFCGIWVGSALIAGYHPISGLTKALDTYIVTSLADKGHASIILFSLGFGGIIGVISANGGMKGIVKSVSKYAQTPQSSQVATLAMGVLIFFDDYANTLFVGNMMRPFTDRLKVSREKLAYLVDSTSAPVASLAVISTWSVFQMSLLEGPYHQFGITESPYLTFIRSVPYSYYCILTLIFIIFLLWGKLDFGQMFSAEKRARLEGKVIADNARPLSSFNTTEDSALQVEASHWSNAMIPVIVIVMVILGGLYITGKNGVGDVRDPTLRMIIGSSDSYASLMWGSFFAGFTAILLSIGRGIMNLKQAMEAWVDGARALVMACIILVLAWSLGKICEDVKTADYLLELTQSFLTASLLPAITFVTAAAISFSTGTSFGTMSILVPIVVPISLKITGSDPDIVVRSPLFLTTFAAILSGAVFGDHCSPISDTTILSSMASGSDHVDHVRTQLPYALTTAIISIFAGYLLTGFGVPWIVTIVLGIIAAGAVVRILGKRVPDPG